MSSSKSRCSAHRMQWRCGAKGLPHVQRAQCEGNQLAHHLRAQGVPRDDLVGICVERGLEMVIGLFGILKRGAHIAAGSELSTGAAAVSAGGTQREGGLDAVRCAGADRRQPRAGDRVGYSLGCHRVRVDEKSRCADSGLKRIIWLM